MIQFFAPDILTNPILPESDSQHCIKVLRMAAGDMIQVINGRGKRFTCRIIDAHHKHTLVEVVNQESIGNPWQWNLTVAVAPTKHLDRIEWLVEKLTEIGINRFVPLLCQRSERRELKVERIEKIAVSAMKQSLKTVLPQISPMTPIKQFISDSNLTNAQRFVAYCDKDTPRRLLAKAAVARCDTVLMIGPEGDFTPDEINLTLNNNFSPVSLGDCRLRTETAALAACQTIHVINQLSD